MRLVESVVLQVNTTSSPGQAATLPILEVKITAVEGGESSLYNRQQDITQPMVGLPYLVKLVKVVTIYHEKAVHKVSDGTHCQNYVLYQ